MEKEINDAEVQKYSLTLLGKDLSHAYVNQYHVNAKGKVTIA